MEEYKELGLTNNEGKVYETLVKFGKLGAGEISKESGVSYSKIYDVLGSLIKKGLAEVVPEKTKKFIPGNPESLIKLVEEKQKRLGKALEKAKEIKGFYKIKEKNPVIMVSGKGNFYKIVKELGEIKKYDYAIKWTCEYRHDWAGKSRERIRKGKDLKVLTRYDKETEKDVKKWLKIHKSMRKIENEGVAMSIVDDERVMISLIKSNVTLLIRNSDFAKVMKNLFINTYKNAGEIK